MRIEERRLTLKGGRPCLLRSPVPADASALLDYLKVTAGETPFMLRTPDEVRLTLAQEEALIAEKLEDKRSVMVSAFTDGALAGNGGLYPVGDWNKCRHRAMVGLAVLERYWGQGIGLALLEGLLDAGADMGYSQVELEVATPNAAAIALYERCGFVRYGERPRAFRYEDGSDSDELLMVKYLV